MSTRGGATDRPPETRLARPGAWVLGGLARALARAIDVARAHRPEWRGAFAWIVHSWLRPPDADARWEQEADRSWWQ